MAVVGLGMKCVFRVITRNVNAKKELQSFLKLNLELLKICSAVSSG